MRSPPSEARCAVAVGAVWVTLNLSVAATLEPGIPRTIAQQQALLRIAELFEARSLTVGEPTAGEAWTFHDRVFPPKVRPGGPRLPVVIYLHGSSERGTDNLTQLHTLPAYLAQSKMQQRFPCWILSPQCPPPQFWRVASPDHPDDDAHPGEAVLRMLDDVLTNPTADPDRVYLIGST